MLTLHDVHKSYPLGRSTVEALAGVDLHVEPGEIHGIVGRSGAGKSTLIRCLSMLERPTSGTVVLDGQDVTRLPERKLRIARRRIGMVFQQVNLVDSRTAAANIRYPLEVARTERSAARRRVDELLDLVGLGGRGGSYPAQLSGGQRQRIGIARALATEPAVLLCDEPTSALDPGTTDQILTLIASLRERLAITVVLVTHEMAAVRKICDTVSLLDDGRLVESGPIVDVATRRGSRLARELVPAPPADRREQRRIIEVVYGSRDVPTAEVLRVLVDVSEHAEVASATVESLRGEQVGRLQLSLDASEVATVAAVLERHGLMVDVGGEHDAAPIPAGAIVAEAPR